MKCVVCDSHVYQLSKTDRIKCDTSGCNAYLCSEVHGAECWAIHNKTHPEKGHLTAGAALAYIRDLKTKLKSAEDRAVAAEGQVTHWKAVNHATDVNSKARFGALVKWMRAACPDQLKRATADGLASEADILQEG